MNYRTVLMTSAAAVALTSNAWAAQGDTYLSLFGGYSTLTDTNILHYNLETISSTVSAFNPRTIVNRIKVPVVITRTTASGTSTTTLSLTQSFTRIGTMQRSYMVTDTRAFSGSAGTDGWVIGAALGVELMQGLRAEAEMAFRRFDVEEDATLDSARLTRRRFRADAYYNYRIPLSTGTKTTTLTAPSSTFLTSFTAADVTVTHSATNAPAVADGELTSFSFMANLWYDFPLGDSGLTPFVGGGIGIANLTLDYRMRTLAPINQYRLNRVGTLTVTTASGTYTISPTTTYSTTPTTITTANKEDDAVFAYQFGAGLGYEFRNGLRLSAQYRYFATTDADFGKAEANVEASDVIFGISFPFGR